MALLVLFLSTDGMASTLTVTAGNYNILDFQSLTLCIRQIKFHFISKIYFKFNLSYYKCTMSKPDLNFT